MRDGVSDLEVFIENGIRFGLDVSWFVKENWNPLTLWLIDEALVKRVSVKEVARTELDFAQKVQVLVGLKDGVDVSMYNDPYIPAYRMKEIREKMLEDRNAS